MSKTYEDIKKRLAGTSCNNSKQPINQKLDSQAWFNSLLKRSAILDKQSLEMLAKWFPKQISKIELKHKASEHEFNLKTFFQTCGDLPNLIIMIKTTMGKVLGGYTPFKFFPTDTEWQKNYDLQIKEVRDPRRQSFLFSVSQKQKFPIYCNNSRAIIRSHGQTAIRFMGGLELYIHPQKTNCNESLNHIILQRGPLSSLYIYNTSKYQPDKQSYLKLLGTQRPSFLTAQWQAYQVFFDE